MSISPPLGQLGPTDHQAGQAPQPWGTFQRSAMKRPPLYCFLEVIRTLKTMEKIIRVRTKTEVEQCNARLAVLAVAEDGLVVDGEDSGVVRLDVGEAVLLRNVAAHVLDLATSGI